MNFNRKFMLALFIALQSFDAYANVYLKIRYQYKCGDYGQRTCTGKRKIRVLGIAENTESDTIKFKYSLAGQYKIGSIPFKNEMSSLIHKLLRSNSNLYISSFKALNSHNKFEKITIYHNKLSYQWLSSSIKITSFEDIAEILFKDSGKKEI